MQVEIIFISTGPQRFDVDDHYEKGSFYCLQFSGGVIRKFPLQRISSISHMHPDHLATRRIPAAEAAKGDADAQT